MIPDQWEALLYTKEEFHQLCEASKRFDDDLNKNHRVRQEDETFASFIDQGSDALIADHPNLVKKLL